VPSNQQRREAAKRKLQRQLARREVREKVRRRRVIILGAVAAVLVIAGAVWFATSRNGSSSEASDPDSSASATDSTGTAESTPSTPCTYPASGKAAREVTAPANTSPANTGTVDVDITLNGTKFTATLDREAAPCTVNSFLSLASQGFYNDTDCHRLTKSAELNILQCGDPSGKGNGGPGYSFGNENAGATDYPVGTLAMANSGSDSSTGAGTNGSQFFIVYGKTVPSGSYTVFGKVPAAGMKVVDAIAAEGVEKNAQSGKPVAAAKITTINVPADALAATGDYATSSAEATDALPTDVPEAPGSGTTAEPAASEGPTPTTAAESSTG
jgi:peptidyl-prolyl cis-trans isomerase B (cyclophilin B)